MSPILETVSEFATEPYYQRRPFNRIKRAYVEARYSPHYVITPEDLTFAAEHVAQLQAIVREVCEERLRSL